jgi:hypothetical protein
MQRISLSCYAKSGILIIGCSSAVEVAGQHLLRCFRENRGRDKESWTHSRGSIYKHFPTKSHTLQIHTTVTVVELQH